EVGTSASGDDRPDDVRPAGRRHERRCRPGARAEEPDRQIAGRGVLPQLVHGCDEPVGEQVDVEPQTSGRGVVPTLVGGEQIEQQRRKTSVLEAAGHRDVAWAASGAARPVGERHHPERVGGDGEITRQRSRTRRDTERNGHRPPPEYRSVPPAYRSSNATTSSSSTCEKSEYHWPTAWKNGGSDTHS